MFESKSSFLVIKDVIDKALNISIQKSFKNGGRGKIDTIKYFTQKVAYIVIKNVIDRSFNISIEKVFTKWWKR
jgi:hypothetical protein